MDTPVITTLHSIDDFASCSFVILVLQTATYSRRECKLCILSYRLDDLRLCLRRISASVLIEKAIRGIEHERAGNGSEIRSMTLEIFFGRYSITLSYHGPLAPNLRNRRSGGQEVHPVIITQRFFFFFLGCRGVCDLLPFCVGHFLACSLSNASFSRRNSNMVALASCTEE